MTDCAITSGRSEIYPDSHYGGHFVGNRATFCLDADFVSGFDANVLAIPNLPIRVLSASPVVVNEYFFGMHVKNRDHDVLPDITARSVRSHDIAGGKTRWDEIERFEPVGAVHSYIWTDCDAWVNTHYAARRDIVFTLFGTPPWASARPTEVSVYSDAGGTTNLGLAAEPTDMANWDAFCTAVATRYLGKIKYYEVWNEPNASLNGRPFYSGTKAKLAEMVRRANQAVKAVDPAAKIISPAVTGWGPTANAASETYFTGMMAASDGATRTMANWVDIVGVHLYLYLSRTYELAGAIDRIDAAKITAGISALPTWDTESGHGSPYIAGISDGEASQFIERCMITTAAMGIARTFFYKFDDSLMGMKDRPEIIAHRERVCELLMSGAIQSVYVFTNGQMVYRTNEETVFV